MQRGSLPQKDRGQRRRSRGAGGMHRDARARQSPHRRLCRLVGSLYRGPTQPPFSGRCNRYHAISEDESAVRNARGMLHPVLATWV